METTTSHLCSTRNPFSSFSPLATKLKPKPRKNNVINIVCTLRRSSSYGSSRLVDENMIVLRKRIHEMKVVERNYEPPKEWMQWEKQIYAQYDEYICMVLGMVQNQLMNTRPSITLGAFALLILSVPTSLILLVSHFAEAANKII